VDGCYSAFLILVYAGFYLVVRVPTIKAQPSREERRNPGILVVNPKSEKPCKLAAVRDGGDLAIEFAFVR